MVHLVKLFCLGKKGYEQKRRGSYFAQNQFFTDVLNQCFKCWSTKMAITTTNCAKYSLELERKL